MGIFSRRTDLANTPTESASNLGTADTLRAASGTAIEKATKFYKNNSTLVHGIGLVASAILLNRMRGRR